MKTTLLRSLLSTAIAVAALAHMPAQAANILNGKQLNGLYTNGLYTNGLVLNGIQINGTGLSTPGAALPRVESIVLRDGRKLAVR